MVFCLFWNPAIEYKNIRIYNIEKAAIIGAVGCRLFNFHNQIEAWIRISILFTIMRLIKTSF